MESELLRDRKRAYSGPAMSLVEPAALILITRSLALRIESS